MNRRSFLKTTGAALLGSVLFQSCTPKQKRPNFVFFLVDDLGWTDLACQGSTFYKTPHVDRLAAGSMKFTQAYAACTVCSPTRASILTGKYPAKLHLTDWIPGHTRANAKWKVPEFNQQLPHKEITIAEALKKAGYVSASIGKWHLGGQKFYPESQGFDLNVAGTHKGQPPGYFSPYHIPTLPDGPEGEYLPDRMAQEANRFIQQCAEQGKPFFLYLPFFEVHTPLQAKKEKIEKYKAKAQPDNPHNNPVYAGMIESMDEAVGTVMAKLDELGIQDNTIIFFTGDNGGLCLRHVTSNVPLRDGKGSAYEGGVREPLFIKWPDVVKPGSVSHTPVMSIDFYPTILEMAGVNLPNPDDIDGLSLVPLLTGAGELDREALYWHYPHYHPGGAVPYSAIRQGDFRLIEFIEDDHVELYDLRNDIGEKNDLSAQLTEKVDEMRKLLHQWRMSVNAQMPLPNPDYNPELADKSTR